MSKRSFDVALLVLAVIPILAVLAVLVLLAALFQGRAIFFSSYRSGRQGAPFRIHKIRTMDRRKNETVRVLGGDVMPRITPFGRWLRRSRLDEIPQFWNVLKGDMSLIGPRPPLTTVFDQNPHVYKELLSDPPGVTGLATVVVCGWEERLMAGSDSAVLSDEIYGRRCVPRKARIDQIYRRKQSRSLDLYILYLTMARILPLPGRRARRLYRDKERTRAQLDQRLPQPMLPALGRIDAAQHPAE